LGDIVIMLAPLEMLLVNLYVIHRCSNRKYSSSRTCLSMGLFICVIMYISLLIVQYVPDFGSGNGLFIFCGFLFILPIKMLYRAPCVKIIAIACFSWTYTFLLFALSVRIGYAVSIPGISISSTVLLLQTLLYIATFKAFYGMIKTKFLYILEHIEKDKAVTLMWLNIVWFWMVFIFNLSYSYPGIFLFQILSFFTLSICILISFRYMYLQVTSGEKIQKLEKIVYHDELTQLRTRVVLSRDAEDLIKRNIPFHLIFIDLNNFKSVNDRYGHMAGDQYLTFFTHEIKQRLGNRGGFYRIAGDEFVCIFPEKGLTAFLKDITVLPQTMPGSHVKFLGFSYGVASFPDDGNTVQVLMDFADLHMYEMKLSARLLRGADVTGVAT